MNATRIKKGDTVVIISGKDKGREGKILTVYPKEARILVEGINMRKRHRRPRRAGEKGSIIQVATPLASAKAMPKCSNCGKPTRVGFKFLESGTKSRVCKKCKVEF